MLKIFAMFSDEGRTKLRQFLAKLRKYFRANQILDRLFRRRVGVDVYVELKRHFGSASKKIIAQGTGREHTTYSSSSVSWATSGTVIVPLTSSSSLAEPVTYQHTPQMLIESAITFILHL